MKLIGRSLLKPSRQRTEWLVAAGTVTLSPDTPPKSNMFYRVLSSYQEFG